MPTTLLPLPSLRSLPSAWSFPQVPLTPLTIGGLDFENSGLLDGLFLHTKEEKKNKPFTVVLGGKYGRAEVVLPNAVLVSQFKDTLRRGVVAGTPIVFDAQFRDGVYRPIGAERGKPGIAAVGYGWRTPTSGEDVPLTRGTLHVSGIVTDRNATRVELAIPSPLGRRSDHHDALAEFDGAAWLEDPILFDRHMRPVEGHPIWDLVSSLSWTTLRLTPGSNLRYVYDDSKYLDLDVDDFEVGDLVRLHGRMAAADDGSGRRKAIEIVDWPNEGTSELSYALARSI